MRCSTSCLHADKRDYVLDWGTVSVRRLELTEHWSTPSSNGAISFLRQTYLPDTVELTLFYKPLLHSVTAPSTEGFVPSTLPGRLKRTLRYARVEVSRWRWSQKVNVRRSHVFDDVAQSRTLSFETEVKEWCPHTGQWVAPRRA